mmetsp:Transcript_104958/g.146343  ORF Transcript_104958/g.146343 Transcript_104958/m.146343 type:complete len:419 (+) Transcript_104958:108-1364(+)
MVDTVQARKLISIEVCDPKVKTDKLINYVTYTIRGQDSDGSFEVVRRYSEFAKMRDVLLQRWPGIFIPALPPKKSMGNMEKAFIEERRKFLHKFCEKMGEIEFLQNSEEYQTFLKKSGEFDKIMAPYLKVNYEEVVGKYSQVFAHLSGKELNSDTIAKIGGFKTFLSKMAGFFENFKKLSKSCMDAKKNFYNSFNVLNDLLLSKYENNVFMEYNGQNDAKNVINDASNFKLHDSIAKLKQANDTNSIELVYFWIKEEDREIRALLDAIEGRDKVEAAIKKTQDKQKSETSEMQNVLAGKFGKSSIKAFFTKTSKESQVTQFESNIQQATKDIESLNMLHDMITLILAYDQLDGFKKNKSERYYQILKRVSSVEQENVEQMKIYWDSIASSDKIKGVQDFNEQNLLMESQALEDDQPGN